MCIDHRKENYQKWQKKPGNIRQRINEIYVFDVDKFLLADFCNALLKGGFPCIKFQYLKKRRNTISFSFSFRISFNLSRFVLVTFAKICFKLIKIPLTLCCNSMFVVVSNLFLGRCNHKLPSYQPEFHLLQQPCYLFPAFAFAEIEFSNTTETELCRELNLLVRL